jgi:hypothetical protein
MRRRRTPIRKKVLFLSAFIGVYRRLIIFFFRPKKLVATPPVAHGGDTGGVTIYGNDLDVIR